MPRVSLITAAYNGARFVGRTLASVRAQAFTDWEHLVVDDGSSDGTPALVAAVAAEEPRLRLLAQPNGGGARARNTGFAAADPASEYLLFLDHDDVLEPAMLERLVAYLDARPDVDVAYCDFWLIDEDDRRSDHDWCTRYAAGVLGPRLIPRHEAATPFEALAMWGGILPSNALIRRRAFEAAGGFDERFTTTDTDLFMRIALRGGIHFVPERLMLYRQHRGQMSADEAATSAALDGMLAVKWAPAAAGSPWRATFERAMNLRRYGMQARKGYGYARTHVADGDLAGGARFWLGALRRHALYVIHEHRSWRGLRPPGESAPSSVFPSSRSASVV